MKKILITGATGFIGSNFVEANYKDNQIIILYRANSKISQFKKYKNCFFCEYDGTLESLNQINEIGKPDVVLHLATHFVPIHESSDIDLFVKSNILLSMHLAEFCKNANVKNFIFAGTIWQNFNNEEYNPLSLYAATKQSFVDILKYYSNSYSFNSIIIKLPDVYGLNDKRKKIFNIIQSYNNKNISLDMSEGNQIVDILNIKDVIKGFDIAIENINNDPLFKGFKEYRLSNPKKFTLKELVKIFIEQKNLNVQINWGAKPYREKEIFEPINHPQILPKWVYSSVVFE